MIEVTMFVKDRHFTGNHLGVVTLLYDKGKFGVGLSVRNPKDRFDKELGKKMAYDRALENLKTNSFSQIVEIDGRFQEELIKVVPGVSILRAAAFVDRFFDVKDEMIFKMAKQFMAQDN